MKSPRADESQGDTVLKIPAAVYYWLLRRQCAASRNNRDGSGGDDNDRRLLSKLLSVVILAWHRPGGCRRTTVQNVHVFFLYIFFFNNYFQITKNPRYRSVCLTRSRVSHGFFFWLLNVQIKMTRRPSKPFILDTYLLLAELYKK